MLVTPAWVAVLWVCMSKKSIAGQRYAKMEDGAWKMENVKNTY